MAPRWLKASALGALFAHAELVSVEDEASLLQRKSIENKKMRLSRQACGDGLTLALSGDNLVENDLHNGGSLVFGNVHPDLDGVDLEISVSGGGGFPVGTHDGCPGSTPDCPAGSPYCPANPANTRMHGDFVQFSMMCGTSDEHLSSTTLKFELKQSGSAMNLEHFTISVYDVDEGVDSTTGQVQGRETVRACGADAIHMPLEPTADLNIAQLNVNKFEDGCTEVISSHFGSVHNNPSSAALDADQASRTVDFVFNGVNQAELTFSLSECRCGRNLLFAFTPAVACFLPPTTTPAPDQPPVEPEVEPQVCFAIGDPHVKRFDSRNRINMYDDGDFWLIRSDELKVQVRNWAKHWRGQASMKVMAITGSLMNDQVLIIDGPSQKVQLDGAEILAAGSVWSFDGDGPLAGLHIDRQFAEAEANNELVDTVILRLQQGAITIRVNVWPNGHIDSAISMRPLSGQDGWCGNFNGDDSDDELVNLNERFPAMSNDDPERLFRTRNTDFIGCYAADWTSGNMRAAPGDGYTVNECASACHASNFFARRNGERCYCGDSHDFQVAHFSHQAKCHACQSDPNTWDDLFSMENGADCVFSFLGPNREELSLDDCPNRQAAETHCGNLHSDDEEAHNDCVFDACFAPGNQDVESEAPETSFVSCYELDTDNFMTFAGDHKTVNGCALACEGHAFFARRNGEQCFCGGSPNIELHSVSTQCGLCQTSPSTFSERRMLNSNSDCVYSYGESVVAQFGSMCPAEFPYAYRPNRNFDFCCATAEDLHGEPNNNRENRWQRSRHCWDHDYMRCPNKPCSDFVMPAELQVEG